MEEKSKFIVVGLFMMRLCNISWFLIIILRGNYQFYCYQIKSWKSYFVMKAADIMCYHIFKNGILGRID